MFFAKTHGGICYIRGSFKVMYVSPDRSFHHNSPSSEIIYEWRLPSLGSDTEPGFR